MTSTAKRPAPVRNAFIALVLILGGICVTVVVLKKMFAASVTKANAQLVFDAFSEVAAKGEVEIRDNKTAAAIAKDAFRKQTDSAPLDGWGREMQITANIEKGSCTLTLLSAGPDHIFGNYDDISCEQSFDITRRALASPLPSTLP